MSWRREIFTALLLTLGTLGLFSQDVHFGNFDFVPSQLNPAMVGCTDCDYQFGALYRQQAFIVSPDNYRTMTAFVDGKMQRVIRKHDSLSWGLHLLNDVSGTGNLAFNQILASAAYHRVLLKKRRKEHILSYGLQLAFNGRSYNNFDAFTFEEELSGQAFSELDVVQNQDLQYFDLNFGMAMRSKYGKNKELKYGLAVFHLNQLANSEEVTIPKFNMRYSGFLSYSNKLNRKTTYMPKVWIQNSDRSFEMVLQSIWQHKANKKSDWQIRAGFGWRVLDAAQLIFGADYKAYEFAFNYEINTSKLLRASAPIAALELGVKYCYKRPEPEEKPKPLPEPIIIDFILNLENETALDSVRLEKLVNDESDLIEENESFPFEEQLEPDENYIYIVSKKGFIPDTLRFDTNDISTSTTIEKSVRLVPIPEPEPEPEPEPIPEPEPEPEVILLNEPIRLENILYDFDDDKILPDAEIDLQYLLELMQTYPDMVIELSSHTDAQGDDEYNRSLSQRRANSATKWLTNRGIAINRIQSVGYGESQIINQCTNGVECTDDEHRFNRRTEFKIIAGPTSVPKK